MYTLFALLTLVAALAGQVLTFDIAIGGRSLSTSEILVIPDSPVKAACISRCTPASTRITDCNNDTPCLCRSDTVAALLDCETCMFHYLVAENIPAPDLRAGSNVVLSGYAAACAKANITLSSNETALPLPVNWDGPFTAVLPTGGVVVVVIVGALLGFSALYLLSNM